MRRWVWRILLAAVAAASLVGTALAVELKDENFEYKKITKDGEDAYQVVKYIGGPKTQKAVIPSTFMVEGDERPLEVVEIAAGAFDDMKNLTNLTISGHITEIKADVFAGTSLKKVTFENYVGEDGDVLPHIKIMNGAFEGCTELATVVLSDSVGEIGANAFKDCGLLEDIVIPQGVSAVGKNAFSGTGLTSVTFLRLNTKVRMANQKASDGTTVDTTVEANWTFPWAHLETVHCIKSVAASSVNSQLAFMNPYGVLHTFQRCSEDPKTQRYPCQEGGKINLTFTCGGYDHMVDVQVEIPADPNVPDSKPTITTEKRLVHEDTCTFTDKGGLFFKNGSFTMSQDITPIPHTVDENSKGPETDSTCTVHGVSGGLTCSTCGTRFLAPQQKPLLPHNYEKTFDAAKYEKDEEYQKYFKECVLTPATCAAEGLNGYRSVCKMCGQAIECEVCDAGKEDAEHYTTNPPDGHFTSATPVDKDAHTFDEKEEPVITYYEDAEKTKLLDAFDCTKAVVKVTTRKCTVCGTDVSEDEKLEKQDRHTEPADPAKVTITVVTKGDCVTDGKETHTYDCAVCGKHIENEEVTIEAPGKHTYEDVDPIPIEEADCTKPGKELVGAQKCTVCGAETDPTEREIPQKPHTWGEPDIDEEKRVEPTCGEAGSVPGTVTCAVCGATEDRTVPIPATGDHQYSDWKTTKEPTVQEPGSMERTCSVCKHVDKKEIPALTECPVHDYGDWTITKPATATESGSRERTCKVCGHKDVEIIPATGGSGDGNGGTTTPSDETYSIDLIQPANGYFTAPGSAKRGETVTLRGYPNSGYELDWVRVTNVSNGTIVSISGSGDRYSFTMPSSRVEVRGEFSRIVSSSGYTGGSESSGATSRWTTPTQGNVQSVPRLSASERIFYDIPTSHWAAGEINWANQMGYMNGSGGRFNPDGNITFQQLWMVLARITGSHPANMADARRWAVNGNFSEGAAPDGAVTRHQLVTALYRCAHLMGSTNHNTTSLAGYPDSRIVPASARDAFAWAVANGIVGGTNNGRLDPEGTLTRAQFAVILYRFSQRV